MSVRFQARIDCSDSCRLARLRWKIGGKGKERCAQPSVTPQDRMQPSMALCLNDAIPHTNTPHLKSKLGYCLSGNHGPLFWTYAAGQCQLDNQGMPRMLFPAQFDAHQLWRILGLQRYFVPNRTAPFPFNLCPFCLKYSLIPVPVSFRFPSPLQQYSLRVTGVCFSTFLCLI